MKAAGVNNNQHNDDDDINNNNSLNSLIYSTKAVFSSKIYLSLAVVVAAAFWLISNISNQLLFFSPSLTFYWPIPESSIPSFFLSCIIACLTGIVVSMTVYMYRHSTTDKVKKNNNNKSAARRQRGYWPSLLVSGSSSIAVISSVCAGCSYSVSLFLFAFILGGSVSGMIGAAASGPASGTATMLTSLLSTYHIPLQLISIGLLLGSYLLLCKQNPGYCAAGGSRTNSSYILDHKDNDNDKSIVSDSS